MTAIKYRSTDVVGSKVFYREAGNDGAPKKAAAFYMASRAPATCSGT